MERCRYIRISPFFALCLGTLFNFSPGARGGAGTIDFGNNTSSKVINVLSGNPVATNENIQAALYWAPTGSLSFSQIGAATLVGQPLPGLFTAGTRFTGPGTAGGAVAQFQVRAWSGGYATFEQAEGHAGVMLGRSTIIQVPTGNPGASPPSVPAPLAGIEGFYVTPDGLPWLTLLCPANKTAICGTDWNFDPPKIISSCGNTNVTLTVISTVTNGTCPQTILRIWQASDMCGQTNACSQKVTVAMPPLFQSVRQTNEIFQAVWTADAGLTYQFQYKTNLDQEPWIILSNVLATDTLMTFSDIITPNTQRFYRVVLLPDPF